MLHPEGEKDMRVGVNRINGPQVSRNGGAGKLEGMQRQAGGGGQDEMSRAKIVLRVLVCTLELPWFWIELRGQNSRSL